MEHTAASAIIMYMILINHVEIYMYILHSLLYILIKNADDDDDDDDEEEKQVEEEEEEDMPLFGASKF